MKMISKLQNNINTIFNTVQFNKTCHHEEMKKLKNCYDKTDPDKFWNCFLNCLQLPLTIMQRHPRVENTLEFASKFAISLYSFTSTDDSFEPLSPFLVRLFDFLLTYHSAKDTAVRFRICHFLNMLLNSMGEQAFIDDDLCDRITNCMMERLMDRSPKVRAQAVFALHRLQDPSDENCPVIKMFLFHLGKDTDHRVRLAVLTTMGKNQSTLQAAIKRTRDVNERVRKMAYEFISKITVKSLTIKQRDQLLNDGFKDRSNIVQNSVEKVLLPSWLTYFKGEYISLLKALDAEFASETSILALTHLFKNAPLATLLEQVPIDKSTKLIPIEDLTSENVLYWRCVITFLNSRKCIDELELILPELSNFCAYIRKFIDMLLTNKGNQVEQEMKKFILLQLFEIATTYHLSDEVGRKNLNDLISFTLLSNLCSTKIIECIVKHLETVIPNVNARVSTLSSIIGDLRLPTKEPTVQCVQCEITPEEEHRRNMQKTRLKVMLLEIEEEEYQAVKRKDYAAAENFNKKMIELKEELAKLTEEPQQEIINDDFEEEKKDPETLTKCLTILCTMMQAKSVTSLTPTLRTLLGIALECLDHDDDIIHILSLRAVAIACILDKELAKKYIMMLFLQLSLESENKEILVEALKAIFDLFLLYGFEYFGIQHNVNDTTRDRTERSRRLYNNNDDDVSLASSRQSEQVEDNCNFIKILMGLLDNTIQEIRNISTEGLCKLLLTQRISGFSIISRLIILCYNPVNENDYFIRQCLSSFFDRYIKYIPDSQEVLEEAFLPTLRILYNAPETSPLQEIDPYDVATFMLNLTGIITKKNNEIYCAHNNLAFLILTEILNSNSNIDKELLVKSLKNLNVQIKDDVTKENLLEVIKNVLKMVKSSDKSLIQYIQQFKLKLEKPEAVQNTETNNPTTEEEDNLTEEDQ